MKKILAGIVAVILLVPPTAFANTLVTRAAYSLSVPAEWEQISEGELATFLASVPWFSSSEYSSTGTVDYDSAFRLKENSEDMPFFAVSVVPTTKESEMELFLSLFSNAEFVDAINEEIQAEIDAGNMSLDDQLEALDIGVSSGEIVEGAFTFPPLGMNLLMNADVEGRGEVSMYIQIIFTRDYSIAITFASTEDDFEMYRDTFDSIIRSLTVRQEAPFADVPSSHPYASAIADLKSSGIVSGYDGVHFGPDSTLTRAELLKLSIEMADPTCKDCYANEPSIFTDVASDHSLKQYINYASTTNMVSGYGDGTFKPNNPVTVGEAVKMMINALTGPEHRQEVFGLGETNDLSVYLDAAALTAHVGTELTVNTPITRGLAADTLVKIKTAIVNYYLSSLTGLDA